MGNDGGRLQIHVWKTYMTESEELKKNTEIQRTEQIYKEMNEYLDDLTARILYTMKRDFEAWVIYIVVWLSWVAIGFFMPSLDQMFNLFFLFALVYQFYRTNERISASAEFRGAIKTLRIMGMIPPRADPVENKKHFWEEGKELVRAWMTKKEKVRGEAYA